MELPKEKFDPCPACKVTKAGSDNIGELCCLRGSRGISLPVISAVSGALMLEICVDQCKDRLPKIVITLDLVLGLCYRLWCEYFGVCFINQHKKIHARLYVR